MKHLLRFLPVLIILSLISCNDNKDKEPKKVELSEHAVKYSVDTTSMDGYVVWDSAVEGKRPVVLIIHEWWGNNLYPKTRAKQLAELGYLAMAVDLYGNGKTADNPTDAGNLALPFYKHPEMSKARFDAALELIKQYPQADTSRIAAIGYCFGGAQVINLAKMGENLKGVVSFHGNLMVLPADKNKLKAPILVCHGLADQFVSMEEVGKFKHEMDSIHADYTVKTYPNATHAFTNPTATPTGQKFKIPIAYNAAADSTSWQDMKEFFGRIFK